MKQWHRVVINSFDPNDREFCWHEAAIVYATRDECAAIAFRQINRPARNTRVSVS